MTHNILYLTPLKPVKKLDNRTTFTRKCARTALQGEFGIKIKCLSHIL